jgi:ATP-dependent DNA helicase RecQ
MKKESVPLQSALKKYFGFATFRPLQEAIIRDALAGKDVFALLPTGGGKSLCFQLPALVQPGLTVVVSPLIALMKDQVDALQASGVAATFLNSSLSPDESRALIRGLHHGEYRLLYVAPERLMLSGFLNDLQRWKPNLIAVDEAHCISEWGHDFRPEYRQISQLRGLLPDVPVMALTATATDRVRADIVEQLHLREPACYIASFNRPNLNYRVASKSGPYDQVLEFIRARPHESGIVYCQARKTAEGLAERLRADGVNARPYHAELPKETRAQNQELFLRDEVNVICATIAFGMGINKPNVRFVIHHDLPKNIEGYYQETGRAGRDGLPSECLLLFSAGDVVKQTRFIDEKPEPEKHVARSQLQQMVHYAEGAECRRSALLEYFGETFPHKNCGACDNCLSPRETYDGTLAAQKFLSCVYRIRERGGFGVGLNHILEVLTGADTEKIRKWGHKQLSTYGIGQEHSRPEWAVIGRELLRLGYVNQDEQKFNVIELTAKGRAVLKERNNIRLTKPMKVLEAVKRQVGDIACDEVLFERLRRLRKQAADERQVPPYIIFSDVALRQMARAYPENETEFRRVSGVGEKKLAEFGRLFLGEIASYLQSNPRQIFADDTFEVPSPAPPRRSKLTGTVLETLKMFRAGKSVEGIARQRALASGTILGHLAVAVEAGEAIDLPRFISAHEQAEIESALKQHPGVALSPAFQALGGRYDYGLLRLVRAAMSKPSEPKTRQASA